MELSATKTKRKISNAEEEEPNLILGLKEMLDLFNTLAPQFTLKNPNYKDKDRIFELRSDQIQFAK